MVEVSPVVNSPFSLHPILFQRPAALNLASHPVYEARSQADCGMFARQSLSNSQRCILAVQPVQTREDDTDVGQDAEFGIQSSSSTS